MFHKYFLGKWIAQEEDMQHVFLIGLSEIRQSNSRYFLLTVFAAHLIGIYLYEMKNFCTKEHFRYIYFVCNLFIYETSIWRTFQILIQLQKLHLYRTFLETKLLTWATIYWGTSKCTWDDIKKIYLSKSSTHATLPIL